MSYDSDEQFTRISGTESPVVELSSDAAAQVAADGLSVTEQLQAARSVHDDFMQHRQPDEEEFLGAVRTAGRPLIITATSGGLVRIFTADDMDSCPECCEHFADPHAPGCSLDPINQED